MSEPGRCLSITLTFENGSTRKYRRTEDNYILMADSPTQGIRNMGKTYSPRRRLVIETVPPPEGEVDLAPKVFEGAKEIANILELIIVAMRSEPPRYPVVSTWCGRKIISITFTQEEEDDGIRAAPSAEVGEGNEPGKGKG